MIEMTLQRPESLEIESNPDLVLKNSEREPESRLGIEGRKLGLGDELTARVLMEERPGDRPKPVMTRSIPS
jgi:hypothetical protein